MTVTIAASPYRGLLPFGESDLDALFFFGREREVEVIAANLLAARLTVLYGPTGVGKSSVLHAGVVRALRTVPFSRAVVVFDSWADDPACRLAEAVAAAADIRARASLVETLADAGAAQDGEVYLILDQFEEYFVYHGGERGPGPFLAELGDAVTAAGVRANVLVCLREDALAKLDVLKTRVPALFSNYLRLDHLDRSAARDAIVGPVGRWNELFGRDCPVSVEPGLVEAILDQVETGKVAGAGAGRGSTTATRRVGIEAPYLQLVLERLWEVERAADSQSLRLSTLRALGGAAQIVGDHFEHALQYLDPSEQEAAAAIFHHLVTPSGTKIAHTLDDLARYAAVDVPRVRTVVDRLLEQRLLRATGGRAGAAPRFEIFHDVLARPVLDWRTGFDARRIEAGARREAERRRRRAVLVAAAALAVLLLVTIAAVFALVQRQQARTQARHARANALAAQAVVEQSVDPQRSVARALAAARLSPSAEIEDVLRASLLAARLRRALATGSAVRAVAYAPSGTLIAVGSADGRVRIWDPRHDRLARVLGGRGPVSALAYSADAETLLAVGGGTATLWNTATWEPRIERLREPVVDAVLSSDGRMVAIAGGRGVSIRRTGTGMLVRRISTAGHVLRVVFSPEDAVIAVVVRASSGRVGAAVYDVRTGRLRSALPQPGVTDIEFRPRGSLLATASADGTVSFWRPRTGQRIRVLDDGGTAVRDVTFSADGTMLATASSDGGVRVWRVADGSRFFFFIGHTSPVNHVAFAPDGDYLVSTSEDRTARIWAVAGIEAGKQAALLAGSGDIVSTAAFAPDGRSVATGAEDGVAGLWDAVIEQQLVPVGSGGPSVAAVRPRGADGGLTELGDARVTVRNRDGIVGSFAFRGEVAALTGDGSTLASAARNSIVVQQVSTGRRVATFSAPASVVALAFANDGRRLAAATADRTVIVWDLEGRSGEHRFHAEPGIVRVAVSPDGAAVLTADRTGRARLWSSEGRLLHVLRLHTASVTDARFDASGRWLITASEGSVRNVALWEVSSGRLLHVLIGHFGTVTAASFSADGRWILTAGPISAGVWSVETGRLLFYLRGPADLLTDAEWGAGYQVVTAERGGIVRTYRCQLCRPVTGLEALAAARLDAARPASR